MAPPVGPPESHSFEGPKLSYSILEAPNRMEKDEDELLPDLVARFGDDLWLSRRQHCGDIANFLSESTSGNKKDWLKFIKFLELECAGANFLDDKQWGELLNLMQISRKLNHRTVKFRDLIKNRRQIEENEKLIRRLNLAAKSNQTIAQSLEQLEQLLQVGVLELPNNKNENNDELRAQLVGAKSYLESRCWPLLNILKLELDDGLVGGFSSTSKQVAVWRQKLDRHQSMLIKLLEILNNFIQLENKLAHLKPLLLSDTTRNENQESSKTKRPELVQKINSCRQSFVAIHDFYISKLKQIYNLLLKNHDKILLTKLVGPTSPLTKDGDTFKKVIQELEDCQLALDEIMRTLRLEFGRFYFISDLELLTIITLDAQLITRSGALENKQIICKLFNNSIGSFVIENQVLTKIVTPYGEIIQLVGEPVMVRKKVNLYSLEVVRIFTEMLRRLRQTLQALLFASLNCDQFEQDIDTSLPVQLMILAEHVRFCQRFEASLESNQLLDDLIKFYQSRFVSLKKSKHVRGTQLDNAWLDSFKHSALISITVHLITQLTKLRSVRSLDDWLWTKHVRYYHLGPKTKEEQRLEVRICGATFAYKFDLLPLQTTSQQQASFKRLISTHLGERCFLVAGIAVGNFRLGACPYGPAGSGKTETIKALGHLLGCQVIVHNCDESNDRRSLDRLIWGLAHAGLWGCFDEFNRLSSSALSGVSATLELVQASIREGRLNAELPDGSLMCIDPSSAFFVTLNPGDGAKYKGRRRLPANMRHLFMPVAMIRVDIENIVSELILTLPFEGQLSPEESLDLGKRLASWLDWMRQNTDTQGRCEWDLRLVMVVLKRLKKEILVNGDHSQLPQLLVQCLASEVGCRLSQSELIDFNQALAKHLIGFLTEHKSKLERMRQLEEQLETHTGVILLGPSKSGKSLTWRQLAQSKQIPWLAINPRSCPRQALFGYVDPTTKKWIDGLVTARVREAQKILEATGDAQQVWLVFDGPIDPDWIESLNSVLDDNQVLTLSSGERLDFVVGAGSGSKAIKLLFETDDISCASPATISRLGLVYHEQIVDPEKQQVASTSHLLEDFIKKSTHTKLCALIGGHGTGDRLTFIKENILSSETLMGIAPHQIVHYHCSGHSNSQHLVQLIERFKQARVFILHNVHLIGNHDTWKTIDFFQLLRFILTYDGYYLPSDQHNFVTLDAKFIITADSLDQIADTRLLNLACVIDISESQSTNIEVEDKNLNDFLEDESLVCLATNLTFSSLTDWELCTFSSSQQAKQSIATLVEILEEEQATQRKQKRRKLFVLEDLECRLMEDGLKSNLFHWLNLLSIKRPTKTIKFIYLTNNKAPTFWRSIAACHVKSSHLKEHDDDQMMDFGEYFRARLAASKWRQQADWLASKVSAFYREKIHQESYVDLIAGLIEKSTAALELEQRTLSAGLAKLADFERSVRRVQGGCLAREEQLAARGREMEAMMRTIDAALRAGELQRSQLALLKEEQREKRSSMEEKSGRLEAELAQVARQMEASKLEVARQLRPEALNEIRSLRSPPKTIRHILEVLLVFLEGDQASGELDWPAIKSRLASTSIKDQLMAYDFERNLGAGLLARVEAMMASGERAASFTEEQATRASQAALPLVGWIKAALAYGRVLLSVRPLHLELAGLREESRGLDQRMGELGVELKTLDEAIERDRSQWQELKRQFEGAEASLAATKRNLAAALKVRAELDGQVARWRRKLEKVGSVLAADSPLLVRLSLAAATLGLCHQWDDETSRLLSACELGHLSREEFLRLVISLILGHGAEEQTIKGDLQTSQMLQLVAMRLCHLSAAAIVPFLDVGQAPRWSERQLAEFLSLRNLLCDGSKSVALVRPPQQTSELAEWCQLVELQFRLDKLVVFDLASAAPQNHAHLDIVHLIKGAKGSNGGANSLRRAVIVGRSSGLGELRDIVRPIELRSSTGASDGKDCQQAILNKLLQVSHPSLSASLEELEQQVRSRQSQSASKETELLRRLAYLADDSTTKNNEEEELPVDLVEVLNGLHQLSATLEAAKNELEAKQVEVQRKQEEHFKVAQEAASFYLKFLAPLSQLDPFYHVSLEQYLRWLLPPNKQELLENLDYGMLVERAMRPMRPQHRLLLREKLQAASIGAMRPLVQLEKIIDELTVEEFTRPKLLVVLHEATKSSPQLELEELLKRHLNIKYSKEYATSDSSERLEAKVGECLGAASKKEDRADGKIVCLCVVNAHLAASWINGHLTKLLLNSTANQALIILVGERESGELFDGELYDYANARYWHDELALELANRFRLFERSLLGEGGREQVLANDDVALLTRKLILFHVVCQELTKGRVEVATFSAASQQQQQQQPAKKGWLKSYTFDYDQLVLARKSLLSLAARNHAAKLAPLIGCYLEWVIYGPRMEHLEDERLLASLARVVFCDSNNHRVVRLLASLMEAAEEAENMTADCDSLLASLLALDGS